MSVGVLAFVVTLAAIVYAWLGGGRPERIGAGILLAMLCIGRLGHVFLPRLFHTVDPVALIVDLIGFLGFSALGIYSRRVWPLWAGSLQLLSTGAHFVRALEIPVRPPVYYWMKSGPTLAVILLLLAGTCAYQRRESQRKSNSSPS